MRILRPLELVISILLSLSILEAFSLVEWVFYPYFPDPGMFFARLDLDFFFILLPVAPLLLVLVLYGWLFEAARVLGQYSPRIGRALRVMVRVRNRLSRWIVGSKPSINVGGKFIRYPRAWLTVAVFSAVLLVYIPYRNDLNPSHTLVGIDSPLYSGWIDQMLSGSLVQAVVYAFGIANHGSRPFLLLPVYLTALVSGLSSVQVVEFLPLVLAPLSGLSSYVLARSGLRTENLAAFAAFLTVASFPFTVGMWAGYFANWLALIETNLFLASLLIISRAFSAPQYSVLFGLSLALLLTHPWTWAFVLLLATAFTLSMWRTLHGRQLLKLLVPILATNLIVDFLKTYLFGGWGIATYVGVRASGSGPIEIASFWQNLVQAMVFTYDGLLSNAVILLFAIISVLNLKFSDQFDRLLLLWIGVGSVIFPFLASYNQTRIIYDLPIPMLAAIGTLLFVSRFNSKNASRLILILVMLFNANYAIRSMIHLVAPIPW